MNKLNKLPVKQEVAYKLAVGESQTSIAEQVGVNQSTISRFANEEEAIKAIEEEKLKLVEVLPDAVANVKSLVEGMKDVPEDDVPENPEPPKKPGFFKRMMGKGEELQERRISKSALYTIIKEDRDAT